MAHSEKRNLFMLLALAALVRALYLWLYSQAPIWDDLIVDSLYHIRWADSIAGGNLLGDEVYFRAPFYVYLLAGLRWLAPDSILIPRLFGTALGIVSIFLTYRITRRIVRGEQSERAGLVAGIFQALYPTVLYFEAELLVDFLFVVLVQLTVLSALVTIQTPARARSFRGWLLTGLALGLACITRPTALALVPLFGALAWKFSGNALEAISSVKRLIYPAAVIAGTLAAILPVTARNIVVGEDSTLIASSGGINFYIGNNPRANPVSANLSESFGATWTPADMIGQAEIAEGRKLKASEVSWSWTKRGLVWIGENPLQFALNYLEKLHILTGATRYSNNQSLTEMEQWIFLLRFMPFNFALLIALSVFSVRITGIVQRERGLLLGVIVTYAAVVCLFFVTERFRLPCIVLLFPLAGAGALALGLFLKRTILHRLTDSKTDESHKFDGGDLRWLVILVAVFFYSLLPFGRPVEQTQARSLYLLGNKFLAEKDFGQGIQTFRELIYLVPGYPRAALNLGVIYFLQSNADSAERYFRLELESHPRAPEALVNLASLSLTKGDSLAADSFSALAYHLRPYDLTAFRVRLRALGAMGARDSALALLGEGANRFSPDPRYWYERGGYFLRVGDSVNSLSAFRQAADIQVESETPIEISASAFNRSQDEQIERLSAISNSSYQAGFLYGVSGQYQLSANYSARAISLDSTLLAAYLNLSLAYLAQGISDSAEIVRRVAHDRFSSNPRYKGGLDRLDQAF